MKNTILTIAILFLGLTNLNGQTLKVKAATFEDASGNALSAVQIKLFQDNQLVENFITNAAGKATFKLENAHGIYDIIFAKEGWVSKMVRVDLSAMDSVGVINSKFIELEAGLFPPVDQQDFSFLTNHPSVIFVLNDDGEVQYDRIALKKTQTIIKECQKGMHFDTAFAYASHIEASTLYNKAGNYLQAAISLEKSLETIYSNQAQEQVEILYKKAIKQINAEKDQEQKLALRYEMYLARGDHYFALKDNQKAKAMYQKALTLKPTDKYLTEQIKKCN
jgi:tetratricopeptide (TPR) repeat protein